MKQFRNVWVWLTVLLATPPLASAAVRHVVGHPPGRSAGARISRALGRRVHLLNDGGVVTGTTYVADGIITPAPDVPPPSSLFRLPGVTPLASGAGMSVTVYISFRSLSSAVSYRLSPRLKPRLYRAQWHKLADSRQTVVIKIYELDDPNPGDPNSVPKIHALDTNVDYDDNPAIAVDGSGLMPVNLGVHPHGNGVHHLLITAYAGGMLAAGTLRVTW